MKGKKAVVLGGTSGIGLATTKMLRESEATVVAVSRNAQKAKDLVDENVQLKSCDVRNREDLSNLFKELKSIDYLVCAATGGERAMGPFLEMDLDGYQRSFDKLWGYTNAVRLAAEYLTEMAAIVLISGAPARRARPGQVSLASVGGAVEAFCRTIAPEIAPRRINVVSPGLISTPMFGDDVAGREKLLGDATANHLIPRPGLPEEVASAIMLLLQNEFVTGTTIDVDGGWLLS